MQEKNQTRSRFKWSKEVERITNASMVSYDQVIRPQNETNDFSELGSINGKPVLDCLPKLMECLDNYPFEYNVFKPPKLVYNFRKLILLKFPTKVFFTLLNTWPSAISQASPTVKPIIDLIRKMISMSSNPMKVIAWLISAVAPRHFGTQSQILHAATLAKNELQQWVFLDADHNLIIFTEREGNVFAEKYKGKAIRAEAINNTDIIIYGKENKELFTFTPCDSDHVKLWIDIFNPHKKIGLIQFFTVVKQMSIPTRLTRALSSILTSSNGDAIRVLYTPGVIHKEDIMSITHYIMNISAYLQRVTLYLNFILTAIFEQPHSTLDYLCNEDPYLECLFMYYRAHFIDSYIQNFLIKLANYIQSVSPLEFTSKNAEKIEKVLFTCIKYVLNSIQFIPPEIQHLCSMLKAYATVKFNSKGAVFRIISSFFAQYIVEFFISIPKNFLKDYEVKDARTMVGVARLLKTALMLGSFSAEFPKFASFDKRLSKYFKKIEDFMLELAVIHRVDEDGNISHYAPEYKAPDKNEFVSCLGNVYQIIVKNAKKCSSVAKYHASDHTFATSAVGWTIAAVETEYFKNCYEDKRSDKKKAAPSQAVFNELFAKHICTGPDAIPAKRCNTVKVYVRVKNGAAFTVNDGKKRKYSVIKVTKFKVVRPNGKKRIIVRRRIKRNNISKEGTTINVNDVHNEDEYSLSTSLHSEEI